MELVAGENDRGRRLDRVLRKALPEHPLPLLHRLLRQGKVFVNGKPAAAQYRLESGAVISIPLKDAPMRKASFRALPRPDIIWQGAGLLAVNKPAGLAVHGAESLDEIVRAYLAEKITPSLSFKPGPLHRLDKPSSGIVVFSANIEGARLFSSLMRERKIEKKYLAIVEGEVKNDEVWKDGLIRDKEKKKTFVSADGKEAKTAVTAIKPLASNGEYTLIQAEIATGRTHQIRAQAAAHGHPLEGDKKYSSSGKGGFFLHAWKLKFLEYSIEAPLPSVFEKKIADLFARTAYIFS